MLSIANEIRQLGGAAHVATLRERGVSSAAVRSAARSGRIIRIRRGWYAARDLHPDVVRAIRVGGRLGCISGCAVHGLWTPNDGLHVIMRHGARHLKHPDDGARIDGTTKPRGLVLHWGADSDDRDLVSIGECLIQALECQPPDLAFAILESALHRGMLSMASLRDIAQRVPRRRALVESADSRAESGTESVFRYRILLVFPGLTIRAQVDLPGVGRVDFVIGDRLVIEIDSEAHHGAAANRMRDLRRDAAVAAFGGITLRFDYRQVFGEWHLVEAAVRTVVERGQHMSTPPASRA